MTPIYDEKEGLISVDGGNNWYAWREYMCDQCGLFYWGYWGREEDPIDEPCPECGNSQTWAVDTFGFAYFAESEDYKQLKKAGKLHAVEERTPNEFISTYRKQGLLDHD